ncbi:MAG TPA: hypothetical protein VGL77_10190, partial [Armatimonadota bacterium]
MSRSVVKSSQWWLVGLLLAALCLLSLPTWSVPIVATPQTTPKRVFTVCLLLLSSQKGGNPKVPYWNPDPWILPVLNRSVYKPAGWILDNPLAPGQLVNDPDLIQSGDGYAADGKGGGHTRSTPAETTATNLHSWYLNGRDNTTPASWRRLTKDDPAYWVVKLDQKSLDALTHFDLLILNGHTQAALSNADRDMLRLLLNRGATIWLNNSQRDGNQLINFFLDPPISLKPGPYTDRSDPYFLVADPQSWLLNAVYPLTGVDVNYLRDNRSNNSYIASGIAGYAGGASSLIREIVRLQPRTGSPQPAIAAGHVGTGTLIVTGSDLIGGTSDWWEFKHNSTSGTPPPNWPIYLPSDPPQDPPQGPCTLSTQPDTENNGSSNPNPSRSYASCCKFFFNMLASQPSWPMIGGDTSASRSSNQSFAASLHKGWSSPFVTLTDPVAFGNYVAVIGNSSSNGKSASMSELRVYRAKRVTDNGGKFLDYPYGLYDENGTQITPSTVNNWWTASSNYAFQVDSSDSETDYCFTIPGPWIGSPVFNTLTRTINGKTVTSTVLYALGLNAADSKYYPYCYALDPYISTGDVVGQVGNFAKPIWRGPAITSGTTRPSMTLSNNRLVITTFGLTSDPSPRIYIYDATNGLLRATVGANPEWNNANFRLLGPASIITAQIDSLVTDVQAGDTSVKMTAGINRRKETMEFLVVCGEYLAKGATWKSPTLFFIPPMIIANVPNGQTGAATLPADLKYIHSTINATGDGFAMVSDTIGDPTNPYRNKNIVSMMTNGSMFKIIFRSWDAILPPSTDPAQQAKLTFSQRTTTSNNGAQTVVRELTPLRLSMGYGIGLRGYQFLLTAGSLGARLTLHAGDGDSSNGFGYIVDAPPLVYNDQIIVGTNTGTTTTYPVLKRNQASLVTKALFWIGTLTAYRLVNPNFSLTTPPTNGTGDIAWRFFGDTLGPKGPTWDLKWNGYLPNLWHSDFPYPAAAAKDTIFTASLYRYSGSPAGTYDGSTTLDVNSLNRGMLYAVDPAASRYLQQTVMVGTTAGQVGTNALRITTNALVKALRVGARALLLQEPSPGNLTSSTPDGYTWDLGHVTAIRGIEPDFTDFTITFDRPLPTDGVNYPLPNSSLLVATSTPFVSHVQGWDTVSGAEPVRDYSTAVKKMTRVSEGISATSPVGKPVNPDKDETRGEAMVAFTPMQLLCHIPGMLKAVTPTEKDGFAPSNALPFLYMPRLPSGSTTTNSINYSTNEVNCNYTVDYRTGRIQFSPEMAGEYADRFVVVHYYTNEHENGAVGVTKVHHAEIMHVPSPIKWEYLFPDAIPDSGPVVVNDTVYISAQRKVGTVWQPTLYAFAAAPDDPLNVQPLWMSAVGPAVAGNLPYRGITTPTPTTNGILVGTAMQNGVGNELALFSDRGTLIADGHRILRVNGDKQVTWQASATKDFDPAALKDTSVSEVTRSLAVVQQGFTKITRMHRLPNGNILACDTDANRVVELNREGSVIWQYPDSDLTYQDPDYVVAGTSLNHLRTNVAMGTIRKVTDDTLRINEPRDVRRYTQDIPNCTVTGGAYVGLGTIRWETTLIADTGNNRIIEVYRPLLRLDTPDTTGTLVLAPGFQYRPDFDASLAGGATMKLEQTSEVIADGASLNLSTGTPLGKLVNFTIALRYQGADNSLSSTFTPDSNPLFNGVRSKELLAVLGNQVADPGQTGQSLRTVQLHRDTAGEMMKIALGANAPAYNALAIRTDSPHDYAFVKQLDLVTMYDKVLNKDEVHALVVDQSGVRETYLRSDRQTKPVFEMTQADYATALGDSNWNGIFAKWRADTLFAPVAMMRLDPGNGLVTDFNYYKNVSYRIAQMNTLASPNPGTWMTGSDGLVGAQRRIHLFEARYVAPDTIPFDA